MTLFARLKHVHTAVWLWLIVFALYLPAWHAGFVTDAIDWLNDARTLSFRDYLNRSHSSVHALYQTTQLVTLGFYRLFGTTRLLWHLLFISFQAWAGYRLFILCKHLFAAANLRNRKSIALWGAILFCVSPYLSEVVVWKACFHYLQGILLMLTILTCVERYIFKQGGPWPWVAAVLFALSAFSLEMFYLTPILTVSMLYYYRFLGWSMATRTRTWLLFLGPQVLLFGIHLAVFHLMYGEWASHNTGGAFAIPALDYLAKGAQYAFHMLLFGRFWPQDLKEHIYALCQKPGLLFAFYGLLLAFVGWITYRACKGYGREQAGLLLILWTVLAVGLALPMTLEHLFDLSGNRYLYLPSAFAAVLCSLLVSAIPSRWIKVGLACGWIAVSVCLTVRTNRHWQTSERINHSLLQNFPPANGKTTILLSMPYCYKGIPMINAWPYGNYAHMHDALVSPPLEGKVYDGMAFNMIAPSNGSEVAVVNDSTVKVTLSQWATWWWYMDFGGYSYETPDYSVNMRDQGHWYELTLKRPFDEYQLLYQVGDKWQVVTR